MSKAFINVLRTIAGVLAQFTESNAPGALVWNGKTYTPAARGPMSQDQPGRRFRARKVGKSHARALRRAAASRSSSRQKTTP